MKLLGTLAGAAMLTMTAGTAFADSAGVVGANTFPQQDGKSLYAAICQGCHMPDAKGAIGAGAYPALAHDQNLAAAGYPVFLILYGQKAMPGFGGFLSDAQVAAVVNYIRTSFGNTYTDAVKPDDIKASRNPEAVYFTLD
ncbi:MAG TPA: cytochrome c [Stellaceae bacterium]